MTALNFPAEPDDGDTYGDYFYDAESSAWRLNPSPLVTGPTGPVGAQGKFTVSPTAPVDPVEGDTWFYSEDGTSFIWYEDADGGQWVEFGNLSQGPAGENGAVGATGPTGPRGLSDTPAGVVVPWPSTTPPTDWLLCDGSQANKNTYPSLFAVIGYTYGGSSPSNLFNLPNLSGRVVVGRNASDASFDALGETGGSKTHTLTTSEIPSHTHAGESHSHATTTTSEAGSHSHTISTNSAGTHGHNSSIGSGGSHSHGGNTTNTGGHSHSHSRIGSLNSANVAAGTNALRATGFNTINTATTSSAGNHSHNITTNTDGSHNHSISIAENGSHSHSGNTSNTGSHTHTVTVDSSTATVQNTGGGLAHNNLQPYITLNYIIKATAAEVAGEPELAVRVTALENANEVTTVTVNTIVLDFSSGDGLLSRTVTGNIDFSVFAYATGAERTVRLVGDASTRALTFPAGWIFLGTKPTELTAGTVGVLNLRCFGSNEANCVAQWGASVA